MRRPSTLLHPLPAGGIIPAIESAHAVAYGMKLAKTMGKGSVLINLSGRGDKDLGIVRKYINL